MASIVRGAVAELAARRHGVLSRQELIELGASPSQIERAVRRGELLRPHAGVFRVAGAPNTYRQKLLLAVHAAGPDAVASHRSAAVLWELDGVGQTFPEVTTPRHLRSWAEEMGRAHESKDLHLTAPVARDAIPCTDVCRTVLDLGAVAGIDRVQTAADDAVRRGLCTWDDLVHALARHSRQGRSGCGPLRAVLEASVGREVPGSRFNRLVERLLIAEGFSDCVLEHEVRDRAGRFVARVDVAFPRLRIAVELDGRRYHQGAAAFESDRARQNRLEIEGWLVLRYTWKQFLERPQQIVSEIRAAILSRQGAA